MTSFLRQNEGLTLLEVVVVLVIAGIISVVVLSGSKQDLANLDSQTGILKTHIRYTQIRAINSGIRFGVKCDGTEYWVYRGNNPNTNALLLNDDVAFDTDNDRRLELNPKKISITAFGIYFDARGIPYDETSGNELAADLAITVTPAGSASPSRTVTITQLTGYVP